VSISKTVALLRFVTRNNLCRFSKDPEQILSRVYEELDYEFQKTLKPATTESATEPGASASTDNEKDTNKVNHEIEREEVTQSPPGSKKVERSSSGGIFSCFRGSKVTDVTKDDVYEKTANDGKIRNIHTFLFKKYIKEYVA
jgi:hypothetical protein